MQRSRILRPVVLYVQDRSQAPDRMGNSLRRVVQQLDPNLPVFRLKTMEAQVDESLFTERLIAGLSIAFGFPLPTDLVRRVLYHLPAFANGPSVSVPRSRWCEMRGLILYSGSGAAAGRADVAALAVLARLAAAGMGRLVPRPAGAGDVRRRRAWLGTIQYKPEAPASEFQIDRSPTWRR